MDDALKLFIPITKIDEEKRLVYGQIAAEVADKAGEIMDYASAKPQFEKWSSEIAKATNGKSMGNVRVMHGTVAAGRLDTLTFDDAAKTIEGVAKIVDDAEWKKVTEGIYTGFSMGGKYVKRWKDPANAELTRYTPEPFEVSIVDNPCIPTATFQFVKADGQVELRKFHEPAPPADTKDGDVEKVTTAEGDSGDKAAAVEKTPVNDTDSGVEQVWKSKDGQTFAKKSDAITHNRDAEAKAAADAVAAPALAKLGEIQKELDARAGAEPVKEVASAAEQEPAVAAKVEAPALKQTAAKPDLQKGLYDVGRLACLIDDLTWLQETAQWEAVREADGSAVPESIKASIATLCGVLRAMVVEETGELFNGEADTLIAAAAALPEFHRDALRKVAGDKAAVILEKAGARHSKDDLGKVQKMHDMAVELGADCGGAEKAATGDLAKAVDALSKTTAERDAMAKTLGDLTPTMEEVLKRVKNIEAQPMPGGPSRLHVVSKEMDNGGRTTEPFAGMVPSEADLAKMTAEDIASLSDRLSLVAIKVAHAQGRAIAR